MWWLLSLSLITYVSMAEIELILSSYPNKAIGHHQIPARVLRDGASVLVAPIARLTNTVIDNACVAAEWKLAHRDLSYLRGGFRDFCD